MSQTFEEFTGRHIDGIYRGALFLNAGAEPPAEELVSVDPDRSFSGVPADRGGERVGAVARGEAGRGFPGSHGVGLDRRCLDGRLLGGRPVEPRAVLGCGGARGVPSLVLPRGLQCVGDGCGLRELHGVTRSSPPPSARVTSVGRCSSRGRHPRSSRPSSARSPRPA